MTRPYQKRPVTWATAMLALVCAVLWAGQSVAVKVSVEDLQPYLVMCLRVALCAFVTGVWAWATGQSLRLRAHDFRWIALNAALLYTQIALYTFGTDMTTSVRSIVLINSFPFFTAIACHYFLPGFPFERRTITGLTIAFCGLLAVFGNRFFDSAPGSWRGDLLVLAAAAVVGGKVAFVKSLLRYLRPVQIVFWGSLMAAPLFLILSLTLEDTAHQVFSQQAILAVLYQGVAVSGLAVLLWGRLLTRHSPNDLNAFRLATPLLGILLGWIILQEPVSPNLIAGGVLLTLGIYRAAKA